MFVPAGAHLTLHSLKAKVLIFVETMKIPINLGLTKGNPGALQQTKKTSTECLINEIKGADLAPLFLGFFRPRMEELKS